MTKLRSNSAKWHKIFWILWGAYLRIPSLFSNSFHSDEALFASWARAIAVWQDPWLQTAALDKPPLLFYLQAIFYPMQGPVEWAARLPNFIASILLIPLLGHLAQVWGIKRPIIAMALIATAPLSIQFSSTAFTDPLLTALIIASLISASTARVKTAGTLFGLALLTKYQAILFAPMIILCLLWFQDKKSHGKQSLRLVQFSYAILAILSLLLLWEYGRSGQFLLWQNQINNYGGLRLAWSWELWPRLWGWIQFWAFTVGAGWLLLLGPRKSSTSHQQDDTFIWSMLTLYIIGYLAFHWLLAIPVWDRYMLPATPLIALVIAYHFSNQYAARQKAWPILLFLLLLPQALFARTAGFPIGGTPNADDGAAQIAQHLEQEPYGTVLYDHWYSWQWGYHLFDDKVHVSWVPHPQQLQRELQAFGDTTEKRYIVLVADERATPFRTAVQEIGFALESIAESDKIILYRLERNKNE